MAGARAAEGTRDDNVGGNRVRAGLTLPVHHMPIPPRVTAPCHRHTPPRPHHSATPQHIVLPESEDKRVLAAAADVVQRGLAKITLLGDPTTILVREAEAGRVGPRSWATGWAGRSRRVVPLSCFDVMWG